MTKNISPERRQFERRRLGILKEKTWIFDPTNQNLFACTLLNVSIGGASIRSSSPVDFSERIHLLMDVEEYALECNVKWQIGERLGVEFA